MPINKAVQIPIKMPAAGQSRQHAHKYSFYKKTAPNNNHTYQFRFPLIVTHSPDRTHQKCHVLPFLNDRTTLDDVRVFARQFTDDEPPVMAQVWGRENPLSSRESTPGWASRASYASKSARESNTRPGSARASGSVRGFARRVRGRRAVTRRGVRCIMEVLCKKKTMMDFNKCI